MDFITNLLPLNGYINLLIIKDRLNKILPLELISIREIKAVVKAFL